MRLEHWAAWGVKGKNLLAFVQIRVQDNVNAQHQLVTVKFGITSLVAVLGWSMGAGQTFQWAVRSAQLHSALFHQALQVHTLHWPHSMVRALSQEGMQCGDIHLTADYSTAAIQRWCPRFSPSVARPAPAPTTRYACLPNLKDYAITERQATCTSTSILEIVARGKC